MRHQGVPCSVGVSGIVAALIATSVIISLVTGLHGHWPFVLVGILVGLWAVRAINR